MADPATNSALLTRVKCLQVLAAANVKLAGKAPSVAVLREEVAKVIHARRLVPGPAIGGGGAASALLPRGLLG